MKTVIATVFAFALAAPSFGAITFCDLGAGLTVNATHGAPSAQFGLLLNPILHIEAHPASVTLMGSEVVIDQQIGPEEGPLFPPNAPCFPLEATSSFGLAPGSYTVRWTVRRMEYCETGVCEAERATFVKSFTVGALVCRNDSPRFDTIPSPPVAGTSTTALIAYTKATPFQPNEAIVGVSGREIHISQSADYSSSIPPPPGIYCISAFAPLGNLAPGRYNVVWTFTYTHQGHSSVSNPPVTFQFSMDVLDPASIPALHWSVALALCASLGTIGALFLRSR